MYLLAVAHTLLAGEDGTTSWGRWITVGSVILVSALTALRAMAGRAAPAGTAQRSA